MKWGVRMNLSEGTVGESYTVVGIDLPEKIKRRLQMLGMTKDTSVSILNRKFSGAVIIKIRGTRFALGKAFSEGIEVKKSMTK